MLTEVSPLQKITQELEAASRFQEHSEQSGVVKKCLKLIFQDSTIFHRATEEEAATFFRVVTYNYPEGISQNILRIFSQTIGPVATEISLSLGKKGGMEGVFSLPELSQGKLVFEEEVDYQRLAVIISDKKISLDDVRLPKSSLVELCRHLTYVSLSGKVYSKKEMQEILKECSTSVKYLILRNLEVESSSLQNLSSLERLELYECSGIKVIPELKKCCSLILYACPDVETIEKLVQCRFLNVERCHNLKSFEGVSGCRFVYVFDCDGLLTTSVFSSCEEIYLTSCRKLLFVEGLKQCAKFFMNDCPSVEHLPSLPRCRDLLCVKAASLVSIGEQRVCCQLQVKECSQLESIGAIPYCKIFRCVSCSSIEEIGDLPWCTEFVVDESVALKRVGKMPFCTTFSANMCSSLEVIGAMEECTRMVCSGCPRLESIGSLNNCLFLDCRGAPLKEYPHLPPEAEVLSDEPFHSMEVDSSLLSLDPKSYLLEVGRRLEKGWPFPYIRYVEKKKVLPSIDVGGLRRDFISRLFQALFSSEKPLLPCEKRPDGWLPLCDGSEEESLCYKAVGQVLAQCYKGKYGEKMGLHFSQSFFEGLLEPHHVITHLKLSGVEPLIYQLSEAISGDPLLEDLPVLLQAGFYVDAVNGSYEQLFEEKGRQELKELLILRTKQDFRVCAIAEVSTSFQKALGEQSVEACHLLTPVKLQKRLQGELTTQLLKEMIVLQDENPNIETAKKEEVLGYLARWVDGATQEQIEKFVWSATGNTTMGGYKISISLKNLEEPYPPVFHTCTMGVDLRVAYSGGFEQFCQELDWAIGSVGGVGSFSVV